MPQQLTNGHVDILLEQLKLLSKEDRILMGLYFYEQLEVEEIAIVLGESVSQISRRLEIIETQVVPQQVEMSRSEKLFSELFG